MFYCLFHIQGARRKLLDTTDAHAWWLFPLYSQLLYLVALLLGHYKEGDSEFFTAGTQAANSVSQWGFAAFMYYGECFRCVVYKEILHYLCSLNFAACTYRTQNIKFKVAGKPCRKFFSIPDLDILSYGHKYICLFLSKNTSYR